MGCFQLGNKYEYHWEGQMSNKLLMANQKEKKTNLRHQIAIIRQIILIFFLLSLYLGINPTSVTAMNSGGTNEGYIQGQIDEVRIGNVPDSGDGITMLAH